ncbi:MAG: PEP-CTERM sorting domain-containing protein [Thermoguttaceae bacterium]
MAHFLYSGSTITDLGTLGGTDSHALGINASGQVVGYAYTTGNAAYHAFLYSGSTMIDLNTLIDPLSGWTLSDAQAINNAGQIVGWGFNGSGYGHAFLLTPVPEPSTLTLLGISIVGLLAFTWRRIGA